MKKIHFVVVALVLLTLIPMPAFAQDDARISVKFVSDPWGAEVIVDGESIGLTPFTLDIQPGKHSVSFLLPGFREWRDEIVVVAPESTVFASLQGGDDLRQLYPLLGLVSWSDRGNQLQFGPYEWANGEKVFVDYDLNLDTTTLDPYPFGWLEDSDIRQQLNIVGNEDEVITALQSPSGRYIGFPQQSADGRWMLKIFDQENDTVFDPLIPVQARAVDPTQPTYRLSWSPDETVVGLQQSAAPTVIFCIFLDSGDPLRTTLLRSFMTNTGETVYVEGIASSLSNQGQIFVFNAISKPEFPTRELWLVDCASLTGTRVPIEDALDAAFLPSNEETIIIAHKNGISRANINDLTQSELIADVISKRWGVFQVDLSPTAEYAYVVAGDGFTTTYWLYDIP